MKIKKHVKRKYKMKYKRGLLYIIDNNSSEKFYL